jgi:hypothetical protein
VWALIVLAALVLLVSSLTVWVKRQALDSDAWADASASLLDDPAIRSAVAVFLVDQLYTNVDVDAELEDRLPARADRLASRPSAPSSDSSSGRACSSSGSRRTATRTARSSRC